MTVEQQDIEPQDIATSFARFYRERLAPRLDTQVRPRLEQAIRHLSHSAFDRQRSALEDRLRDVDRPFMLFIVGAGNAGKSSLVNAIAGRKVAPVSIRPLTWKIDVYQQSTVGHDHAAVRWADGTTRACSVEEAQQLCEAEEAKAKAAEAKGRAHAGAIIEVIWSLAGTTLPPEVQLVDTPGIHQIRANLQATGQGDGYQPLVGGGDALIGLAEVYFHRADGVLWVFDGTCLNAGTGNAVENLGFYDREQYAVVNKIDAMDGVTPEETVAYAHKLLGAHFERFLPVSARLALNDPEASGVNALMDFVGDVFLREARVKKARSTWSLVQAELGAAERIARAEAMRMSELSRAITSLDLALQAEVGSIERSGHSALRVKLRRAFEPVLSGIDVGFVQKLASDSKDGQTKLIRRRLSVVNVDQELNAYLSGMRSVLNTVYETNLARIEVKTSDYDFAGRARSVVLDLGELDRTVVHGVGREFTLDHSVAFDSAQVSLSDDVLIGAGVAGLAGLAILGPVGILIGVGLAIFGGGNNRTSSRGPTQDDYEDAARKLRDAIKAHRDKVIENAVAEARRLLPQVAQRQTSAVVAAIEERLDISVVGLDDDLRAFEQLALRLTQLRQRPLVHALITLDDVPTHTTSSGMRFLQPHSLVHASAKLGRDDQCWCLSGMKYEACHLKRDQSEILAEDI